MNLDTVVLGLVANVARILTAETEGTARFWASTAKTKTGPSNATS